MSEKYPYPFEEVYEIAKKIEERLSQIEEILITISTELQKNK